MAPDVRVPRRGEPRTYEITSAAQMNAFFVTDAVALDADDDDVIVIRGPGFFAYPAWCERTGRIGSITAEVLHDMAKKTPRTLCLVNQPIALIPETLGELGDLEELYLRHTLIKRLPPSILELKKLRHLDLCKSARLKELSGDLAQLPLEYLDVTGTKLAANKARWAALYALYKQMRPGAIIKPVPGGALEAVTGAARAAASRCAVS